MMQLAQGMAIVAAADLYFIFVFLGIGLLLAQVFHWPEETAADVVWRFWGGWAVVYVLLPLWSLFFAVDWRALALISSLSLLGWAARGRPLPGVLSAAIRLQPRTAILLCLVLVWAFNRALMPVATQYDAGLYHLNTIRWANTYAAVPGLGNLHGRLAFNSSSFLYIALVNVGPLAGRGWYVANNLLSTVLLAQLVTYACRIVPQIRSRCGESSTVLGTLLLIPFLATYATNNGTSTTTLADMVQILLALCLLRMLATQHDRTVFVTCLLLCDAAVTTKLSGAAFVLAAVPLACCYHGRTALLGHAKRAAVLLAVGLVPWMARGVVLSGYPLYPSTIAAFPVPWRVPAAQALQDSTDVQAWARLPGPLYRTSLHGWQWLAPWLIRNWTSLAPPTLLTLCFCLLVVLRRRDLLQGAPLLVGVPAACSLVIWFWLGPEPGFAEALLWLLPAALVIGVVDRCGRVPTSVVLGAYLAAALWSFGPTWSSISMPVTAGPDHGFYPAPTVPLRRITLDSNLRVWVPQTGDQSWDAPLPASPYPNLLQHQVRPGCATTLACGFEQVPYLQHARRP